jgi:NAD-dependent dihydropyrimidine dehydrogenase PreA subunit
MTLKTVRKVVKINKKKCNGCGVCITSCAEGALKITGGKARLISEKYCDGLGNCLQCPQGAISIEERPAEEFNEAAAQEHLEKRVSECPSAPGNCPGAAVRQFSKPAIKTPGKERPESGGISGLTHWPVQLTLVPPAAPFLKGAGLVLAAHCVPFADANFPPGVPRRG